MATLAHLFDELRFITANEKTTGITNLYMYIPRSMAPFTLHIGKAWGLFYADKPGGYTIAGAVTDKATGVVVVILFYDYLQGVVMVVFFPAKKEISMAESAFGIANVTVFSGGDSFIVRLFSQGVDQWNRWRGPAQFRFYAAV